MKKIYYLFCLVAVMVVSACTHEEEDLFDSSSADRADATIKAYTDILTGAENGWLMEYYPEMQQKYGGYNTLVKFDADGKVTVSSDIYGATDAVTSLYLVKQSAGAMLSFDTYNEIFHFYSDPSDPSGLGGAGYGMEGDYDFLILEATPEKVVVKGKKSGNVAVMTPVSGSWADYITEIQTLEAAMLSNKYTMTVGGKEIFVRKSQRTLSLSYEMNGETVSQKVSYIVTPTGMKFYAPITVNGTEFADLIYDESTDAFASSTSGVTMVKILPTVNELFVEGDWFIAYSRLGSFAKPYFDMVKDMEDDLGEVLQYAFMGSMLSESGTFGFNFISSGYGGVLYFNYQLIGDNQIALQFAMDGEGNGVWYHNKGMYNALIPFGYNSPRLFTLTTDDIKNPTYITLTEDANPANSMTLFAAQISLPLEK